MKIYERPRSYRCVGKKCSYFMNPLNIPLLQIANFLWGEIQILKLIYREKATKVEIFFFKTTYLVTSKQCSMEKSFYSRQKKSPSINCPAASYTQLLCSIFSLFFLLLLTACQFHWSIKINKYMQETLKQRILLCSDLTFCKW